MKGFNTFWTTSRGKRGKALECSINKVYFRKQTDYVDESTRGMVEDSAEFFWRRHLDRELERWKLRLAEISSLCLDIKCNTQTLLPLSSNLFKL
jgi:hypothetical protein